MATEIFAGKKFFHALLARPEAFYLFLELFGNYNMVSGIVDDELSVNDKDRILDLGCGTGYISKIFPSENFIGVDSDKDYIEFARRKYRRNFLTMNAADLKFADGYFDIVFISNLFHHLTHEMVLKVLSEVKRVLKPGGQALLMDISYVSERDSFYKKAIRMIDRGKNIMEFDTLRSLIMSYFKIKKNYLKKGLLGDNAVFLVTK